MVMNLMVKGIVSLATKALLVLKIPKQIIVDKSRMVTFVL